MAGRVNHRGWIVMESIQSTDGSFCVDFFEDPGGGYGFEHFRSDPEDSVRWTVVGGFGMERYESAIAAADAAIANVAWLNHERKPKRSWQAWREYLEGA